MGFMNLLKNVRARLGMDLPSPKDILEACTAYRYSPDAWKLSSFFAQHVFIPDEMMRSQNQNQKLSNCTFKGTGITCNPYSMLKQPLEEHTYPIILEDGIQKFPVMGELWRVPVSELYAIDAYKRNGNVFIRRRIQINIPYQEIIDLTKIHDTGILDHLTGAGDIHTTRMTKKQFQRVSAWMYFANPIYWNKLLPQTTAQMNSPTNVYKPVKVFRSRIPEIGEYHLFTRADCA